jgi:hypothetical protein
MLQSKHVLVLLTVVIALGLTAGSAAAAAAGEGNSGSTDSAATLIVSPNPVASGGATYHMSGCGYDSSKQVNLVIAEPTTTAFFGTPTDSTGCIYATFWTDGSGTYDISASQTGKGHKQIQMASTTLTVT